MRVEIPEDDDRVGDLVMAAASNDEAFVSSCLAEFVFSRRVLGNAMFQVLMRGDNEAMAARLLSLGASPRGRGVVQPVVIAAKRDWREFLEMALKAGADPSEMDGRGLGALHAAGSRGHAECVGLLLAAGADPWAEDDAGRTALWWAMATGRKGMCMEIARAMGAGAGGGGMDVRAAEHGMWGLVALFDEMGMEGGGVVPAVALGKRGVGL